MKMKIWRILFGVVALSHIVTGAPAPKPAEAPPPPPPPMLEGMSYLTLNRSQEDKYFHEPVGHERGADDRLGHYDVRYFHGMVTEEERAESLHHMIIAYLNFFRQNDLETWIAHGTLLGWWWNGEVGSFLLFKKNFILSAPNLLASTAASLGLGC